MVVLCVVYFPFFFWLLDWICIIHTHALWHIGVGICSYGIILCLLNYKNENLTINSNGIPRLIRKSSSKVTPYI